MLYLFPLYGMSIMCQNGGGGERKRKKKKIYASMDRESRGVKSEIESKTNKQKKNHLCQDHEGGA